MSGKPNLSEDEQWVAELGSLLGSSDGPGFKARSIGAEYVGEFDGAGWRIGEEPEKGTKNHAVWEILASTGLEYVTERWDPDQRDEGRLEVDESGAMENSGGMDSYVMDPKTGEIYLFSGTKQTTRNLEPEEIEKLRVKKRAIERLEEDFRRELEEKGVSVKIMNGFAKLAELRGQLDPLKQEKAKAAQLKTGSSWKRVGEFE